MDPVIWQLPACLNLAGYWLCKVSTKHTHVKSSAGRHLNAVIIIILFIYLIGRSSKELSINCTYRMTLWCALGLLVGAQYKCLGYGYCYIQYTLQITANRPFNTLPHSRHYFSPRSYHQITVSIRLTCQRMVDQPVATTSSPQLRFLRAITIAALTVAVCSGKEHLLGCHDSPRTYLWFPRSAMLAVHKARLGVRQAVRHYHAHISVIGCDENDDTVSADARTRHAPHRYPNFQRR